VCAEGEQSVKGKCYECAEGWSSEAVSSFSPLCHFFIGFRAACFLKQRGLSRRSFLLFSLPPPLTPADEKKTIKQQTH
jgi:hypothetical protein